MSTEKKTIQEVKLENLERIKTETKKIALLKKDKSIRFFIDNGSTPTEAEKMFNEIENEMQNRAIKKFNKRIEKIEEKDLNRKFDKKIKM